MPESPPIPTPEQLWQWMISRNIRIQIFPQPAAMSWDSFDPALGTITERVANGEGLFYGVARYRESGSAIFKAHSFATPGEAYDAAWAGMLRYMLTIPEQWQSAEERPQPSPHGYAAGGYTNIAPYPTRHPTVTELNFNLDGGNLVGVNQLLSEGRMRSFESQLEGWRERERIRRAREGF